MDMTSDLYTCYYCKESIGLGHECTNVTINGMLQLAHIACHENVVIKSQKYWTPQNHEESVEGEPIKSYGSPDSKVSSRQSNLGYHLLSWEFIKLLGDVCLEGHQVYKEGAVNGANIEPLLKMDEGERRKWIEERGFNHVIPHLLKWLEGDRTEKHLTKVGWFCMVMTEMELRMENENK